MHGRGAAVGGAVDMSGIGNHYYSIPNSLHGSGVAQCFDMLHNLGHKLRRDIKTVEHKTEEAMLQLRHGDSGPSSPMGKGALLINPGISSAQHDPF